ncbi:MAG: hypothetical protein UY81_C0012G0004 [Candidatus Giovannonibacteria bacterium GW2011_GWA2_53_7]|uniref:Uncharacterized protein n=1 Tax=Candidatus Giovannonibacteria bacterium GW2011_GWA2_53_7 TaxID=1618650 RepID=A0A0G1Y0Y8_9BACT|nr:MAG: hypothetical protein UY81_C0012G0004 [Candidatus Giovannonibacteria bacterium GW2011_GWA2_53_7]
MSLRRYLSLMAGTTILSWIAWSLILFRIDPQAGGNMGRAAFFISLLFALTGTFSLIGLGLRMKFVREPVIFRQTSIAFRQGILLGCLLTGGLILQATGFLRWWNLIAYLLMLAVIEFLFLSREQKPLS